MGIKDFWPTVKEINNCIKVEAENAHESLLLAVHQSLPLNKKLLNHEEEPCKEKDLLLAFTTENLSTGTLLLPIKGASGAGKSHLVRWLDAQLKRNNKIDKMHVIRIPKSASLRKVVELILSPLQGEEYKNLHEAFRYATEQINPENAVIQFRAGLEIALTKRLKQIQDQIIRFKEGLEIQVNPTELQQERGHVEKLPMLFDDGELREHFDKNVFSRLVRPLVEGRKIIEGQEIIYTSFDNIIQFQEADLQLPDSIELSNSSKQVQSYYGAVLDRGVGRQKAVQLLNSVLDEAIRNAFQLGQNIGGLTLQDIILEVRRKLFLEGKELILLIEDFAALSGIQEPLLNICIQEAIRDGKQIYCTMRTCVAVTDGYKLQDTIETRAQYSWILKKDLDSEEKVLHYTIQLVGAYLNAARHGQEKLAEMFAQSKSNTTEELTSWITPFKDENTSAEDWEILQAFGQSDQGFWLFPFNRDAINVFAKAYMSFGGKLTFNPRYVISYILREVLLRRDLYEKCSFPPPDNKIAGVYPEIAGLINRIALDKQAKYKALISTWGGNPDSIDKLGAMNPLIFKAFDLASIHNVSNIQPKTSIEIKIPEEDKKVPAIKIEPQKAESPFLRQIKGKLHDWVNGNLLPQADAREIRQALAKAVSTFINWNSLLIKKMEIKPALFWIPNAAGNSPSERVVKIAENNQDEDGNLRNSIIALLRHQLNDWKWFYEEADVDSVYYAEFIEDLSKQVIELHRKEINIKLRPLVQISIVNSQILGLSSSSKSKASVLEAIFTESQQEPIPFEPETSWDKLRKLSHEIRPDLLQSILSYCGGFQGAGTTAYIIDYPRLEKILKELPQEYNDIDASVFDREEVKFLKSYPSQLSSNKLILLLSPCCDKLKEIQAKLLLFFGDNLNKDEFYNGIKDLVTDVAAEGVWPSNLPSSLAIHSAINKSRKLAVKELSDLLNSLPSTIDTNTLAETISIVAKINPEVTKETIIFIDLIYDFINALDKRLTSELNILQKTDSQSAINQIQNEFEMLQQELNILGEGQLL